MCVDSILQVSSLKTSVRVWNTLSPLTHLVEREEEVDDFSLAIWILNHSGILAALQYNSFPSIDSTAYQDSNDVWVSIWSSKS